MKSLTNYISRFYTPGLKKRFSKRILLLGAPGVGKGTFASRCGEILKVPHISTGGMIRAEIRRGTPLGDEFSSYADQGDLIPYYLVTPLVCGTLEALVKSSSGCFVDGFPRTLEGAMDLSDCDGVNLGGPDSDINAVYLHHLGQEDDIIVEKIKNRRVCCDCGKNYNLGHIIFQDGIHEMPPVLPSIEGVCDHCGGIDTLIQREDDLHEETIRHRLEVFREKTLPVIEWFDELGMLKEFVIDAGTKELLPSFLKLLDEF